VRWGAGAGRGVRQKLNRFVVWGFSVQLTIRRLTMVLWWLKLNKKCPVSYLFLLLVFIGLRVYGYGSPISKKVGVCPVVPPKEIAEVRNQVEFSNLCDFSRWYS